MKYSHFDQKWRVFLIIYISLNVLFCTDCNFDTNVCDWSHDGYGDFNWTRQKGTTPSGYTGPDSDHSLHDGYYIYTEISTSRKSGEKARLISPKQPPGSFCLIFWYSMYGQNIGGLNVYMKRATYIDVLLLNLNHSMEDNGWRQANVGNASDIEYRIVFEGVVGDDVKGDIAIDDITLADGLCSADCSFNDGFCNWENDLEDSFDWTRQLGKTPSYHTGPLSDLGGNGFYMFIETSPPRKYGDSARLISPLQSIGQYCLSFWYNMRGKDINTLSLYVETEICPEVLIFSKMNGTNETIWKKVDISFKSSYEYKIIIEGVCGNGSEGDIAVDNITMTKDECKTDIYQRVDFLPMCHSQTILAGTKSASTLRTTLQSDSNNFSTTITTKRSIENISTLTSTEMLPTNNTNIVSDTSIIMKTRSTITVETSSSATTFSSTRFVSKSNPSLTTSIISKITTPTQKSDSSQTTKETKTTTKGETTSFFKTSSSSSSSTTLSSPPSSFYSSSSSLSSHTSSSLLQSSSSLSPSTSSSSLSPPTSSFLLSLSSSLSPATSSLSLPLSSSLSPPPPKSSSSVTTTKAKITTTMAAIKTTMIHVSTKDMDNLESTATSTMKVQQKTPNENITYEITTKPDLKTKSADLEMYILIISIAVVMVMVVTASFFVWRRKRRRNKLEFNERRIVDYYHDNNDFTTTNDDACERTSDNTIAPSEHRLSYRNDYTEVFLQDLPRLDTTDGNCYSYFKNQYASDDNKHIYNHLESNKGHFMDETYSHTSDLLTLKQKESPNYLDSTFSDDEDSGKKNQCSFSIKLDNECDDTYNRIQSLYTDNVNDMVSVDETTLELENIYNTLCSGGPSKRILFQDDYCHINSVKSSELVKESTYPYARVIKQRTVKSNATSDKCEENVDYVDVPDKDKDNNSDTVQRLFKLEEANDDIENHDYYILEKI